MLKKLLVLSLVLTTGFVAVDRADAREFADIYVECGLGALIAPNTPVVAVITNITWDLGTTAISSNISSPENCKGGQADTASFIIDSYELLETDLASGEGAYLDMLATLAEFEGEDRVSFLTALRVEFAQHVSQDGYSSMSRFNKAEALFNMVYHNAAS